MLKNGYIIWNTTTGLYDGAYLDFAMAHEIYIKMSENDPSGEWVLVQWLEGKKLSDEKFHTKLREVFQ